MYETKEDYERLRQQFIKEYGIDEATEEFFQVLYKKTAISSNHRSPRLISTTTVSTETIRDVMPATS